MENGIARELLDELIPHLEAMETQSAAVLRFLREKGIATEKDLASCLDEASMASNVRWRASRLRIERLLSSLIEELEKAATQTTSEKTAKQEVSPTEETKEPKAAKEAVAKEPEPAKKTEAAEKEDAADDKDKAPVAPSKVTAAEKPDAAPQQNGQPAESEKELPEDQKDAA